MKKIDYKKDFKEIYQPPVKPSIIDVPPMDFVMIDGEGDPNGEGFAQATAALYGISYAVKMSYKSTDVPAGYYDYTVFPLEGVWDLIDKTGSARDKNNYKYTIMIRQPEFLTSELFSSFISKLRMKKPDACIDRLRFGTVTDGLCCQAMHTGSYDAEQATFAAMEDFCTQNGYERISKTHREIYLNDPRRSDPSKLITILRFKVISRSICYN